MQPRKNFRSRPKKSGARKKQKVLSQKKRLTVLGCAKELLDKMTPVEIRNLLKKSGTKKSIRARAAKTKKATTA
ncbi:MAG: hypothetical protein ABIA77_00495 [Candidatus Omnitrophota bacterium]